MAVVLTLVLGYFFIADASMGLHDEKVAYLSEISLKSADNVKEQIDGYFSTVEAIATMLGGTESFDADHAISVLKSEADKNFFKRMGIILPDGTTITTDGYLSDFSDREFFTQAMQGKKAASECLVDKMDGKEINVFAAPVYHKGNVVGVIFATHTQQRLSQTLKIDSFDGQGYSYIIKSDGRPVVKTTHPGSVGDYDNFFDSLSVHGLTVDSINELCTNINAGATGSLECIREGVKRHLCYAPVGISDWYIISVIPSDVISQQSDTLIRNLVFLVAAIVLISVVISYKMIDFFQQNNKHLAYIAYTDTVTGYSNWAKFMLDAEEILGEGDDQHFAMVVMDINKFKVINDMFGYQSGNDILKFTAEIISQGIGEGETFCRNAADNFTILMQYEDDQKILNRIQDISNKLESYIVNYKIQISVGVYTITETTFDVSAISDKANISKNIAKRQNQERNCHFFRDENRLEILHEKEIENVMDNALRNYEFEVYLQPKYLSFSDNIVGAEALVRWNRSGVGLLPPSEFIPLFEKNGFIRKLDIYMFESVCKLLADWELRFPEVMPIGLSVNLSRVHLSRNTLPQDLLAIAKRYGVSPELIEIELTESAIFENVAEMKEIMHRIKEAGFMISIDDFGSGYSSLASLKYLPADVVKMDKSFLDEAENDKRGEKIISSMIYMIKNLGMSTVAEGVETRKQLDFLKSAGCDIVQGYFWARPMPVPDFEKLMYGDIKK